MTPFDFFYSFPINSFITGYSSAAYEMSSFNSLRPSGTYFRKYVFFFTDDTLRELPPEMLPSIFEAVNDARLAAICGRLEIDDMLELFEWVPAERHDSILALLPAAKQSELRKHELYAEGSAGRVMTTNILAVDEKITAQEAIEKIRAFGEDTDAILYLYVVDTEGRLEGVVPIRRLVASRLWMCVDAI